MTEAPLIEVRELARTYQVRAHPFARQRALHALTGISFSVRRGTTFGLVGESGSGKTTAAKLLMGAERPTSGRITIDGRAVNGGADEAWLRTRLQPVLQDPYGSLSPRMRVRGIVDEPLRIHRRAHGEAEYTARVRNLLAQAGLSPDYADRHPRELSGGQRQRVAIARALALEPEILVLDEPVSALDVSIQAQILNMLQDLQQQRGLTYFMISHDLAVVAHMSATVGVLYLGALMEIGGTEVVLAGPRHPYTRALIAAAEPRRHDPFPPIGGEIPSPLDPPPGCPFHPRCAEAIARCRTERPDLHDVSPGHRVACHLA